jgi:hypothetical protein
LDPLAVLALALQPKASPFHRIGWLTDNGGYCDCEVEGNAADHWEQNR